MAASDEGLIVAATDQASEIKNLGAQLQQEEQKVGQRLHFS